MSGAQAAKSLGQFLKFSGEKEQARVRSAKTPHRAMREQFAMLLPIRRRGEAAFTQNQRSQTEALERKIAQCRSKSDLGIELLVGSSGHDRLISASARGRVIEGSLRPAFCVAAQLTFTATVSLGGSSPASVSRGNSLRRVTASVRRLQTELRQRRRIT